MGNESCCVACVGEAPRYEDFQEPVAVGENEVVVRVRAASLKQIDRMMASDTHYQRMGALPAVVGVDGAGVLEDGTRVYCGGARSPFGMLAERSVVSRAWCMPLPEELDDVTAAALPNPALSSYLPLVWRVALQPGETVVVLGATGAAGQLAVQIAKLLGAGRVIAVGRNAAVLWRLSSQGADAVIGLDQSDEALVAAFAHEHAASPFDVVLDYLWGHPAEALLRALTGDEVMGEPHRTRYVHIGEMAGATITLAGAALRSSALELYGSGGGSLPPRAIVESFPKVLGWAAEGRLRMEVEQAPLANVEALWRRGEVAGRRLVFLP